MHPRPGPPANPRNASDQALLASRHCVGVGRYYDPATAQFLTRDPLDALTQSAYGYVRGNPLNRRDPSGYKDIDGTVEGGGAFLILGVRSGTPQGYLVDLEVTYATSDGPVEEYYPAVVDYIDFPGLGGIGEATVPALQGGTIIKINIEEYGERTG